MEERSSCLLGLDFFGHFDVYMPSLLSRARREKNGGICPTHSLAGKMTSHLFHQTAQRRSQRIGWVVYTSNHMHINAVG